MQASLLTLLMTTAGLALGSSQSNTALGDTNQIGSGTYGLRCLTDSPDQVTCTGPDFMASCSKASFSVILCSGGCKTTGSPPEPQCLGNQDMYMGGSNATVSYNTTWVSATGSDLLTGNNPSVHYVLQSL